MSKKMLSVAWSRCCDAALAKAIDYCNCQAIDIPLTDEHAFKIMVLSEYFELVVEGGNQWCAPFGIIAEINHFGSVTSEEKAAFCVKLQEEATPQQLDLMEYRPAGMVMEIEAYEGSDIGILPHFAADEVGTRLCRVFLVLGVAAWVLH